MKIESNTFSYTIISIKFIKKKSVRYLFKLEIAINPATI